MKVSVIGLQEDSDLLKRLQMMGLSVQADGGGEVRTLDGIGTDLVYLVSHDLTQTSEWPEMRVRLARAGRYYLIFGPGLGSKEIMAAARDGAHDVVLKEDTDERWQEAIDSAGGSQTLWWELYGGRGEIDPTRLVGRSPAMRSLNESVQRLGPTDATVLVSGESGTGKERVAEAIHSASGKRRFVAVNCAAIPKDLIESELFGVEKGAYTGAVRSKPGLVEEASGGTLFLDEIGELDMSLQPKLLRFLETRRARRVGSTKEYECNVRVVSATNRDLEGAIDEKRFRADLYYRLSEVILSIPPLRRRVEDIPDLTSLFIKESAERMGKNFESVEPELIEKFKQADWPGNVRELKQAIDRLAILYDGPVMRAVWWEPPRSREAYQAGEDTVSSMVAEPAGGIAGLDGGFPRVGSLPSRKEKLALASRLLEESGNDLTWVSAQLGVHPTTLYRWRKAGKV